MVRPKRRISTDLDLELITRLEVVAEQEDRSLTYMLNRAIETYLGNRERSLANTTLQVEVVKTDLVPPGTAYMVPQDVTPPGGLYPDDADSPAPPEPQTAAQSHGLGRFAVSPDLSLNAQISQAKMLWKSPENYRGLDDDTARDLRTRLEAQYQELLAKKERAKQDERDVSAAQ